MFSIFERLPGRVNGGAVKNCAGVMKCVCFLFLLFAVTCRLSFLVFRLGCMFLLQWNGARHVRIPSLRKIAWFSGELNKEKCSQEIWKTATHFLPIIKTTTSFPIVPKSFFKRYIFCHFINHLRSPNLGIRETPMTEISHCRIKQFLGTCPEYKLFTIR